MRLQDINSKSRLKYILIAAAAFSLLIINTESSVQADYLQIYGGPTYTPGIGGYLSPDIYGMAVNDNGMAVGYAEKFDDSGPTPVDLGSYAIRWNAADAPVELGILWTSINGQTFNYTSGINASGTVAGIARKYDGNYDLGYRAVRWHAPGTDPTELGDIGTRDGVTSCSAQAINNSGTIVGYADKYDILGVELGTRAVRWDAGGLVATELDDIGTAMDETTYCYALAINASGTAMGYAQKYDTSHTNLGVRAVLWNSSGTKATELETILAKSDGYADNHASAINDTGTVVGYATKYDSEDNDLGFRAVRWDAGTLAATELGNLGTNSNGFTDCIANAINAVGTAVGVADKRDLDNWLGVRAVRWDASGIDATELGNLGTSEGITNSEAYAINDLGIIVGYAEKYGPLGEDLGPHAVYWGEDGLAVDLNTLIDPESGWILDSAKAISDTGWLVGIGLFDPDGPGSLDPYERLFLLQVPEPSVLILLLSGLLAGGGLILRRCCH